MREASSNWLPRRRTTVLPGGAVVDETWHSPVFVTVEPSGEIDVFDEVALVDLSTGWVLEGAHYVSLDARDLEFVDLVALEVLDRTRRHLARSRGMLDVHGLRPAFSRVWTLVVARQWPDAVDRCEPEPIRLPRSDGDDRPSPSPAVPPLIAA